MNKFKKAFISLSIGFFCFSAPNVLFAMQEKPKENIFSENKNLDEKNEQSFKVNEKENNLAKDKILEDKNLDEKNEQSFKVNEKENNLAKDKILEDKENMFNKDTFNPLEINLLLGFITGHIDYIFDLLDITCKPGGFVDEKESERKFKSSVIKNIQENFDGVSFSIKGLFNVVGYGPRYLEIENKILEIWGKITAIYEDYKKFLETGCGRDKLEEYAKSLDFLDNELVKSLDIFFDKADLLGKVIEVDIRLFIHRLKMLLRLGDFNLFKEYKEWLGNWGHSGVFKEVLDELSGLLQSFFSTLEFDKHLARYLAVRGNENALKKIREQNLGYINKRPIISLDKIISPEKRQCIIDFVEKIKKLQEKLDKEISSFLKHYRLNKEVTEIKNSMILAEKEDEFKHLVNTVINLKPEYFRNGYRDARKREEEKLETEKKTELETKYESFIDVLFSYQFSKDYYLKRKEKLQDLPFSFLEIYKRKIDPVEYGVRINNLLKRLPPEEEQFKEFILAHDPFAIINNGLRENRTRKGLHIIKFLLEQSKLGVDKDMLMQNLLIEKEKLKNFDIDFFEYAPGKTRIRFIVPCVVTDKDAPKVRVEINIEDFSKMSADEMKKFRNKLLGFCRQIDPKLELISIKNGIEEKKKENCMLNIVKKLDDDYMYLKRKRIEDNYRGNSEVVREGLDLIKFFLKQSKRGVDKDKLIELLVEEIEKLKSLKFVFLKDEDGNTQICFEVPCVVTDKGAPNVKVKIDVNDFSKMSLDEIEKFRDKLLEIYKQIDPKAEMSSTKDGIMGKVMEMNVCASKFIEDAARISYGELFNYLKKKICELSYDNLESFFAFDRHMLIRIALFDLKRKLKKLIKEIYSDDSNFDEVNRPQRKELYEALSKSDDVIYLDEESKRRDISQLEEFLKWLEDSANRGKYDLENIEKQLKKAVEYREMLKSFIANESFKTSK